MTEDNDKKPLIDDKDPSTEGGPKGPLAFIIILGSFIFMAILVLIILLAT